MMQAYRYWLLPLPESRSWKKFFSDEPQFIIFYRYCLLPLPGRQSWKKFFWPIAIAEWKILLRFGHSQNKLQVNSIKVVPAFNQ